MKKMKSVLLILLSLLMVASAMTVSVGASSAYQTYTYSIDGKALYSPDAYSAVQTIDSAQMKLEVQLDSPADMVVGHDKKIYIADSGNNRIVVLSRRYEFEREIGSFINGQGNPDQLESPQGVFVTTDAIWVCDTLNTRIVKFDLEGNFLKVYDEPDSPLFDESDIYKPVAMAVDQYGRIYVVSSTTNEGIIVMDSDGNFVGFVGAQAVTISAFEILWRRFQTDEQKKLSETRQPTSFNNLTITDDGYIYATISFSETSALDSAIKAKDTTGKHMPVKLLNPAGDEIMRRNGFWPPAGEIDYTSTPDAKYQGPSRIIDVAVGPEKTWSIIDEKRNKIYTYDFNGNLLFAFGDKGLMLGSISNIQSIAYQGDTMLILDKGNNNIVIYERTEYGDLLIEAIAAENSLNYAHAISCWERVLQRNSNFDAAYVGIGNAMYRSGEYEESLLYFETAYDTENWSNSYKEVRKEWMSKYFFIMIAAIIVAIVLIIKGFSVTAKINKRAATDGKVRKTFGEELAYGTYIIFHPFDGFYDLKHENRGSVRASFVFIGLTVLAFFYQSIGSGYVMNPTGVTSTLWMQLISVVVPLILFVVANWCLTTLFEGEGSFKHIFIASSYSLVPLPLLIIPATLCSNWVTVTEASIVSFVGTVAFIWCFLLLFFGVMVTHDYSMGKNFITVLGTVVAMAFIVFLVLLFFMLISKLTGLVTNIITELQYRA